MKMQKRKDGTIKITAQSKEDSKHLYNWLKGMVDKESNNEQSDERSVAMEDARSETDDQIKTT